MMENIAKDLPEVEDILEKSKEVAKGKSIATAGVDPARLIWYAEISPHTRDNKEFSLSRYPYEAGPKVFELLLVDFSNKKCRHTG